MVETSEAAFKVYAHVVCYKKSTLPVIAEGEEFHIMLDVAEGSQREHMTDEGKWEQTDGNRSLECIKQL